jgi:hypothetical protein
VIVIDLKGDRRIGEDEDSDGRRMKESGLNASIKIRAAAAAGQFYPSDPTELRQLVKILLADVRPPAGPAPKALIAPHAGYLYSGPIAAFAYARFMPARTHQADRAGWTLSLCAV